ncbi:hypothetical protein P3X46_025325 [Hevea brasiliensis]|uniref:HAT C-terminal dimerisation domain-containing protein n=1 Tax=Hevea brasiliensis TaxID=3981 RepID=A0ABQ9L6A9_HEVBR|nr:hypothetical protein P3X46_025325 [Hevea brasiliensis]
MNFSFIIDLATLNRYLKKQCIEKSYFEYDKDNLPADPALHKPIMGYHPNIRDEIWRWYLQKGPCLPRDHKFEQILLGNMAIVIRYVEKNRHEVDHILGIVHVTNTSALSLKATIDALFSKHNLSILRLCDIGHQLQLALAAVVKTYVSVTLLFTLVSNVVNVVGGSRKSHDILQESQAIKVLEALENGKLISGISQNQESTLKRARDTRWLLLCVAYLSPNDYFSAFDKENLLCFAQIYPIKFSIVQLVTHDNQLKTYIPDMKSSANFSNLTGISNLAEKMVKTKRNVLYPLIYRLITLALILPVATASVERAFSAMKNVKNQLRNRMRD